MLWVCVCVFTCVCGHMGVSMYTHVVCMWRPELSIRHLLPSLSTLNVLSASVPVLCYLLTDVKPGTFAFPELCHAFSDPTNGNPSKSRAEMNLTSLSYPYEKSSQDAGSGYTQTNLRTGYFRTVFPLPCPPKRPSLRTGSAKESGYCCNFPFWLFCFSFRGLQ